MTHKELYDVHKESVSLDPLKDGGNAINQKICGGANAYETSASGATSGVFTEHKGKCGEAHSSVKSSSGQGKWENLWATLASSSVLGGNYDKSSTSKKVGNHTSEKISEDIRGLTREQHSVVSSAFAKAHEGAEIVEIRSISTTSVMVNACYDVLAEGLPVSPYGCAEHNERLRW